jgi:hypothetical protein
VTWGEMRISQSHGWVMMPKQLLDCPQGHTSHNQSTSEGMTKIMEMEIFNVGLPAYPPKADAKYILVAKVKHSAYSAALLL